MRTLTRRQAALACISLPLVAGEWVLAQGSKTSSPLELARQAEALKPGEWVWAPDIAPAGPITVYVDLSRQLAYVYRNGVRIAASSISSGKPGHETPTGVFTILQKDKNHRSNKYNSAPMPYQERLTWDGVALHAGGLPGYPESHGCVHLPYEFARLLFGITEMGGTVVVAGKAGGAGMPAGVLQPVPGQGALAQHLALADDASAVWLPDLSPQGPVSVVLSRPDRQVLVMRNGVEIGRARVELPPDDYADHLLTLTRGADGRMVWTVAPTPGREAEAGRPVDQALIEQVRLPAGFMKSVQPLMQPGLTVLVTNEPLAPHTTGPQLAVLDSQSRPGDGPDGPAMSPARRPVSG